MAIETKTSETDTIISVLRAAMEAGENLYAAAGIHAEGMGNAAILRLWKERGGQFLYDMASRRIKSQRHTAGMPRGYSADPAEYRRDRIEEVLSSYIGVLHGDKLQFRSMGELDIEGCQGAAANHEALAAGNQRQAEKFRELASALKPEEILRDLDREVLVHIWWGE
jgi:hypothetical protein